VHSGRAGVGTADDLVGVVVVEVADLVLVLVEAIFDAWIVSLGKVVGCCIVVSL